MHKLMLNREYIQEVVTRFAHSLLQVDLQADGGSKLTVLGPEQSLSAQQLKHRLPCLSPFLTVASNTLKQMGHCTARFHVQLHDEAPAQYCFRFDAPLKDDGLGPLIPDPYVLGSRGFAKLRQQFASEGLPPWKERMPMAIWRGSSTGTPVLTPATLPTNPRHRLCLKAQALKSFLDARITAIVQCPTEPVQRAITETLHQQGLLGRAVSPCDLALHRWILEIDGNVNSWGLLWKLLSGSCVVRVDSERRQWYHHLLKPWHHLVPIASDLSNLIEVLKWCRNNAAECEEIAQAGQRLAFDIIQQLEHSQHDAVIHYEYI